VFRNTAIFCGEELLAPRPTPKLEDHPSSAVSDCLFNAFAAPSITGGRSSIRNVRTPHAVVTVTHLTPVYKIVKFILNGKSIGLLTRVCYRRFLHSVVTEMLACYTSFCVIDQCENDLLCYFLPSSTSSHNIDFIGLQNITDEV
jgi:hypothetical protein